MPKTPHSSRNLSNITALGFQLSASAFAASCFRSPSPTPFGGRHRTVDRHLAVRRSMRIVIAAARPMTRAVHAACLRRRHHVHRVLGCATDTTIARRRFAEQRRVDRESTNVRGRRCRRPRQIGADADAAAVERAFGQRDRQPAFGAIVRRLDAAVADQPDDQRLQRRFALQVERRRLARAPCRASSPGTRCRRARPDYRPAAPPRHRPS